MGAYVVRRLLWGIFLFFIITAIVYVLYFILPTQRDIYVRRTDPDPVDVRQSLRINGPVYKEYGTFVWNIVRHGYLGTSFVNREEVTQIITQALPITLSLVVGGMLIWLAIAIPVGVLSALRPRSILDRSAMIFILLGVSAHPLWIGLMLSYLFGYRLHFMPLGGYCPIFNPLEGCGGPTQWAYHMLLPWLTFAAYFAAVYARMIRASVIENYDEDYVRTARAKGAPERTVLRRHVLRNALMPIVTMLGMDMAIAFGGCAAGAVFVESAFGLNGLGRTVFLALRRQDLPVILGITVCVTTAVVIFNMLADIAYAYIDPRLGMRSSGSLNEATPEIPSLPSQAALVSQDAQAFS